MEIFSPTWKGYELIDAGGNKKLERWGNIVTIRPEVNAYFTPGLEKSEWKRLAHWEFEEQGNQKSGVWKPLMEGFETEWRLPYESVNFHLALTKFKHVGLFPEQVENWRYLEQHIQFGDRLLNLFAYTGAASVVARSKGAVVTHVDSVKQLISWAKNNMEISGLTDIRWVHDDALKYARREVTRGSKYQFIVMDPPAWGVGPNNEKWKLEDKLPELIRIAYDLLDPGGRLILNTYTPKLEMSDLIKLCSENFQSSSDEFAELWAMTTSGKKMFYGQLARLVKE